MKIAFLICLMTVSFLGGVAAVEIGRPAPDFSGQTASGETLAISDYKGKVVLLDFWASWCGPCREEMPFLVDFYRWNKKRAFEIIAVNIDEKADNMKKFLSKLDERPAFPIVVDPQKMWPQAYDIDAMPTTVFIDKHGTVRFVHGGFKGAYKEHFQDELDTLLREK